MSERIFLPLGDRAVLVRLGESISLETNARVHGLAAAISEARLRGVIEVCPAYADLAVHYDPFATDFDTLVRSIAGLPDEGGVRQGRTVEIPVRYGGEWGPDLVSVAELTGLSVAEIVARHTGQTFSVYMLGFLPGFPYMGTLPENMAVPRLKTPRQKVPSGSVGLAGRQTGIYPREAPGGWQIIGRTELRLFEPGQTGGFLLKPGDTVRFTAVRGGR